MFFLRGSYGLWGYLNTSSRLRLRGTVFGGLNPGSTPKEIFATWLHNTLTQTALANRQGLDLLIVDEVDSGTGIGTQLNVVDATLGAWTGTHIGVRITYLAAARPQHTADQLSRTISKWSSPQAYTNATLEVVFETVIGTLLAYDDDDLLGIARRASGYEIIKREGSTFLASCPDNPDCVFGFATAGAQVESVATLVGTVASARTSVAAEALGSRIEQYGCPTCLDAWTALRPAATSRTNL